jgi:hypothetical protein
LSLSTYATLVLISYIFIAKRMYYSEPK